MTRNLKAVVAIQRKKVIRVTLKIRTLNKVQFHRTKDLSELTLSRKILKQSMMITIMT